MRLLALACLMALVITGCSRAKVVYEDRTLPLLRSEVAQVRGANSSQYQGLYYVGSDEVRHFFVLKLSYLPDHRYALFKNDLPISDEKRFYLNESQWVDFGSRL